MSIDAYPGSDIVDPPGLPWAPPIQSSPTVITVPTTGGSYTFADTEDFILELSASSVTTGRIVTTGGRHGRLIGGKMDGSTHTDGGGTSADVALYIGDMGGQSPVVQPTMFIEGLHVDYSAKTDKDLIWVAGWNSATLANRSQWARPRLYLQNTLLQGSAWSGGGFHPDLLQKTGPLQGVKAYQVTGEFQYQGFFLAPQEGPDASVGGGWAQGGSPDNEFSRVNFRVRSNTRAAYALWLNWDDNASTSQEWPPIPMPYTLLGRDVWVSGKTGDTLGVNLVFPRENTVGVNGDPTRDVSLVTAGGDTSGTWVTDALIDGTILHGDPPEGDFCVAGVNCGLGYVSPGY